MLNAIDCWPWWWSWWRALFGVAFKLKNEQNLGKIIVKSDLWSWLTWPYSLKASLRIENSWAYRQSTQPIFFLDCFEDVSWCGEWKNGTGANRQIQKELQQTPASVATLSPYGWSIHRPFCQMPYYHHQFFWPWLTPSTCVIPLWARKEWIYGELSWADGTILTLVSKELLIFANFGFLVFCLPPENHW